MKARFILELDMLASPQANLEFLDKAKKQIKAKEKEMKALITVPKNQRDLEDVIKEAEKDGD